MTTYLVLGSNCFTGSHIIAELLVDPMNQVIGISRSPEYKQLFLPYDKNATNFSFHQIDMVREFGKLSHLIEELQPDVVINVAALSEVGLSNERPVEYFEINTLTTVALCNFLRQKSWLKSYVHISSAEIFGSCKEPVDETVLFNPSTPYAVSKAAADMFINTLIKNYQFPATIIRSTNVYGKHQQLFKIIPRTAIYLKQGKLIELHGGGHAVKSFIHIDDVIQGMMFAMQRGKIGTFHLSVPSERSVVQIVEMICRKMGYDPKICTRTVGERLGQDAQYTLDCAKARNELSWEPKRNFQQGVEEVIAWVEGNWDAILQEPLSYVHKSTAQMASLV